MVPFVHDAQTSDEVASGDEEEYTKQFEVEGQQRTIRITTMSTEEDTVLRDSYYRTARGWILCYWSRMATTLVELEHRHGIILKVMDTDTAPTCLVALDEPNERAVQLEEGRALAKKLDIPFFVVDLTALTPFQLAAPFASVLMQMEVPSPPSPHKGQGKCNVS